MNKRYLWIVWGALGGMVKQGIEPAWPIAEKQAAEAMAGNETLRYYIIEVCNG